MRKINEMEKKKKKKKKKKRLKTQIKTKKYIKNWRGKVKSKELYVEIHNSAY